MGRKWSSISARESACVPSYPTRSPSSSKQAAIAGASCWFQAMSICSYKRRIGCSDDIVSVLDIENNSSHLARGHNELVSRYNNSMVGEGTLHQPFAGMDKISKQGLSVSSYGRSSTGQTPHDS